jgi:hypothetical protein
MGSAFSSCIAIDCESNGVFNHDNNDDTFFIEIINAVDLSPPFISCHACGMDGHSIATCPNFRCSDYEPLRRSITV